MFLLQDHRSPRGLFITVQRSRLRHKVCLAAVLISLASIADCPSGPVSDPATTLPSLAGAAQRCSAGFLTQKVRRPSRALG